MGNAFFQTGVELFHPQRWHMIIPSLKEWAALSLMHSIGSIALQVSGQLAEATSKQNLANKGINHWTEVTVEVTRQID